MQDIPAHLSTGGPIDGPQTPVADRLHHLASDRLGRATNDLAALMGLADGRPAVQARLLDLIADLDDVAHELAVLVVRLRHAP